MVFGATDSLTKGPVWTIEGIKSLSPCNIQFIDGHCRSPANIHMYTPLHVYIYIHIMHCTGNFNFTTTLSLNILNYLPLLKTRGSSRLLRARNRQNTGKARLAKKTAHARSKQTHKRSSILGSISSTPKSATSELHWSFRANPELDIAQARYFNWHSTMGNFHVSRCTCSYDLQIACMWFQSPIMVRREISAKFW